MKKLIISIFAALCVLSANAVDYNVVSTRKLETLTDDSIFVGQCSTTRELELVIEKAYDEVLNSGCDSKFTSDFAKNLIDNLETKKEYDNTCALNKKIGDITDKNHQDFSYDQIVEIINTFKERLEKEKPNYYFALMKNGRCNAYVFLYDVKTKKVSMEYTWVWNER